MADTSHSTYRLLGQYEPEKNEEEVSGQSDRHRTLSSERRWTLLVLCVLLVTSLLMNASLFYQRLYRPWDLSNDLPTQHARLRRDVPRDIVPPDEYSSPNRTIQDAAWNDPSLVTWDLFVALDETYVESQDLPHSQRWPWDESKGVYILYAAHELHCVQVLRSFVNEKQDGFQDAELTWNYSHAVHCLNILRESVMCNADDQPMYTGRLNANTHFQKAEAGRGTTKMCRNWDALMGWAHERSACYLSVNRKDPSFPEIDRYKFCPDGARPWEKME